MKETGRVFPSEARWERDFATGTSVRQVTCAAAVHHHPFFFVPAYDGGMKRLLFISHRTGSPQIFFEDRSSGNLVQATDRPNLAEWSAYPSPDGRFVYFIAGNSAWRIRLDDLREEQLAEFGEVEMRESGMVGAAMGTTALSASGRWWAIPVRSGQVTQFHLIDTEQGRCEVFLERDTIGHPQFCPDDEDLILYAGPMTDRVWLTDRTGCRNRRAYEREDPMQWVTHESWIPNRREIAFVDWPRGIRAIAVDSGGIRWITRFPAWHAAADSEGQRIVCDTNFPDQGIHVFPAIPEPGAKAVRLCRSDASSQGAHWGNSFPYNQPFTASDAVQHTHPHPRFSPDGSRVVFTSDRSGYPQIYEALLEPVS